MGSHAALRTVRSAVVSAIRTERGAVVVLRVADKTRAFHVVAALSAVRAAWMRGIWTREVAEAVQAGEPAAVRGVAASQAVAVAFLCVRRARRQAEV